MKIRLSNGTEIGDVTLCSPTTMTAVDLLVICVHPVDAVAFGDLTAVLGAPGALNPVEVLTERVAEDGVSRWATEQTYAGYQAITGISFNAQAQELKVFVG
ncbi:MAG TPA: hypothetical protein PLP25_02980, partial [Candidatus Limiplasma sp.]|nr:hypothetical protein [Candidatus Limiplasma sp.]